MMNVPLPLRRGGMRWLLIAACVPVLLFAMGAVAVGVREFDAAAKLKAKMDQLKRAGEGYDNASFEQWYRNHTHPEGAQAWVNLLNSVSATSQIGAVASLPIVGTGKELKELDPKAEWPNEPAVNEFLDEMLGLIQQTHQLEKWPTPVQFPIEFNGQQTLLPYHQQSRSVTRLLQLDFEYAFYQREFERAIRDLKSMGTVAEAMNSKMCLVVDLIVSTILSTQYLEIQRSLLTDNWPPENLNQLRELVREVHYSPARWKTLLTNERAMFSDDVALGDLARITDSAEASLVPLLETGRLRIFEAYDELIAAGNVDLALLRSASKQAVERIVKRDASFDVDGGNIWIGLMLPAAEQMATAMENLESNRRLTLTAIALRQFKHQEGHWPANLRELEKVGLTNLDTTTVNRGAFGYEIADGIAYVWGSNSVRDIPVATSRPNDELDERLSTVDVVTLR